MSQIRSFVLNKGYIELRGALGGDFSVVDSARVTSEKRQERCIEVGMNGLRQRDVDLIRSMIEGRHGTPFEHAVFQFVVKLPIFVAREWHRHRISSYNEISMRWQMAGPDFYMPDVENVRRVKDGARRIEYAYSPVDATMAQTFRERLDEFHEYAYMEYKNALEAGIAPEQARYFLPNTFYTEMVWTVNARALMNFLSLRNEEHAMFEIREYANGIERIFKKFMPETWAVFNETRVAP